MPKTKFSPISKGKLRSNNGRNYFHIFLWATQTEYERAAKVESEDTIALCITDVLCDEATGELLVNPKLGEMHFVSGTWDVNTVAHECQHAILHRLRYLHPTSDLVLNEMDENWDENDEEIIAYEAGSWVEGCLAWLTNLDPVSPYPKNLFDR